MKLYGSPASPFVQRVLIAARLKGTELATTFPPGGSLQSPAFQAISPMGRIPLLELDDGRRICESEAIVGYLDETLAGPPLLPADPFARAHARQIASLALGEVAAGMRPLMAHLVFRMGDAADVVAAARRQLGKGLDAIERVRGADDAFAAGERPGIADATLVPVLALMSIVDAPADTAREIAARPGIAAYLARARADPVLGRTVTEMSDGFAAVMARNVKPFAA